ncbi:MAG TPA: CHASE3 domain-containing protein [Gemmataceae bacterium]|nr:CHASE3 domain-containing protein [Gemmataceae bacterium]
MKLPGLRALRLGFGLALLVLLTAGVLSHNYTRQMAAAAEWRSRSLQILWNVEGLREAFVDVQTGARGFVLTGDESMLDSYHAGLAEAETHLRDVEELASDDAAQQQRLKELEPVAKAWRAFAGRLIEVRRAEGASAATRLVIGGEGVRLMAQLRNLLTAMEDYERSLLREHEARLTSSTRATTLASVVVGWRRWSSSPVAPSSPTS